MRVHFVGVSGTGMGQLALLAREAGDDVRGSDGAFDPPMGPALEAGGVRCLEGFSAEHVGDVDLVVVGNAIRRGNVEVEEARRRDLPLASMSGTLRARFLAGRRPLVVTGTHGKTTTSAMAAFVLSEAGLEPGWFIGGLPKNLPGGSAIGSTRRKLSGPARAPFVVEGDEYDQVYWQKEPKFFDYVGICDDEVVILTSIEHDHVDIYPTAERYEAQFVELVRRLPERGLLVADARDPRVRRVAPTGATFYALDGDETGDVTPAWLGIPRDPGAFDVFAHGVSLGTFAVKVPGLHNVRNALATLAACVDGFAVPPATAKVALAAFEGVRRRQDLLGAPGGIAIYDDFAHHPTAVGETLRALKARHPRGRLWAIFEPRSATACRNVHQVDYVDAFTAADRVVFAPLGRTNVPESERLDLGRLAKEIGERAIAASSVDAIVERVAAGARHGDVVAILSNGSFGGIHGQLLAALAAPR